MPVLALGVSYRRATVDLLERLSFAEEDLPKAYQHVLELGSISEAVVVSTCNRIEVYAEVVRYHQGFQDLKRFLAESRDVAVEEFAEPLYAHYEDHAAEHLFSVAGGIDSMVLGEPQILAQVRDAFRAAEREEATGPSLAALFRHAIRVGRRARKETAIGASPAAFVAAGARLAGEHLGGLEGTTLLVVGAGQMGALAMRELRGRGASSVRVLNRSPERAERLAAREGAVHGGLEELPVALGRADLVVFSTGATGTVIGAEEIRAATAGRDRPLFLLDLAVPRDVDPAARELPGVRVADIDDLRGILEATRDGEDDELARVRGIVAAETARYAARRREAKLAPLIAGLHDRGEHVRARELERLAGRLAGLSDRERETVEALTRGIVKTLLHDPVVRLKRLSASGAADGHARALAELFGLDEPGE